MTRPGTAPSPPSDLDKLVTRMIWPAADIIHRIHPDQYAADRFNPGPNGNARFSPIHDAAGTSIPTIYGGTTFDCAAMETVFHDVPFMAGLKTMRKHKLKKHHYSQVRTTTDMTLADLSATALRRLGIARAQLIDTEKALYPHTRLWAEAIHVQCPDIQGLCWVSRQDDRARAVILFGDRAGAGSLHSHTPSLDIADDIATYAEIVALAGRIGVKIIGK